jgi:Glycosyltransferase 61
MRYRCARRQRYVDNADAGAETFVRETCDVRYECFTKLVRLYQQAWTSAERGLPSTDVIAVKRHSVPPSPNRKFLRSGSQPAVSGSLIRVRELDVSSAPSLHEEGPLGVLELWPSVEVDLRSALVEATVQPGVSSKLVQRCVGSSPSASVDAPAGHLVRLEDGMLETRMCVALSSHFGFVRESVTAKRRSMEKKGYVCHETGELTFPDRRVVSVDFPAIHVALPWRRHNYYHWMVECIGGLLVAREFIPRDARVVVRLGLEPFEAETLAALGIAPDSVFVLPPERVVHFPELYVVPRTSPSSGAPAPIVANALRGLAPVHAGPVRPRRIYVTRKTVERRRIVNHDEVGVTLAGHGFSEVSAEDLSVQEQIALFGQAEAVIGVHGAGLTNAVFSPPGTLLIELQPERRQNKEPLFWNLAASSGLRYVQIVCRSLRPPLFHSDIEVDCAHLDAVLSRRLPTL